jgi:16S rRNA (adenine1518-N6/adenine1519-N6)-dimethyltransferase
VRAGSLVPPGQAHQFRTVVLAAFSQRRKSLANALASGLAMGSERTRALCEAANIEPGRRAETLSLAEFARLVDASEGR